MAGKFIDLSGRRIGRLSVGERHVDPNKKGAYWHVACDCGVEKIVRGSQLTSGGTISCGCYGKSTPKNLKHGMSNTFEFRVWSAMRKRCQNPNHEAYSTYGGRGIVVCDRWMEFINFYADMGPCPFPKGSVERVDVDGNYDPSNCVWLPKRLQSANRRVVLKSRGRQVMMQKEMNGLRELIGELYTQLSGKRDHHSDCPVNNAPAYLPGPCSCT